MLYQKIAADEWNMFRPIKRGFASTCNHNGGAIQMVNRLTILDLQAILSSGAVLPPAMLLPCYGASHSLPFNFISTKPTTSTIPAWPIIEPKRLLPLILSIERVLADVPSCSPIVALVLWTKIDKSSSLVTSLMASHDEQGSLVDDDHSRNEALWRR